MAIITWAIMLLATWGASASAQASITLDSGDFWTRLEQTRRLVEEALAQVSEARADTLRRMDDLWVDVAAVRLDNEQVVAVDVSWLRLNDDATEWEDWELRTLGSRITALLRFQRERYGVWNSESMLAALDDVLRDDRFQYGNGGPAPREETADGSAGSGESGSGSGSSGGSSGGGSSGGGSSSGSSSSSSGGNSSSGSSGGSFMASLAQIILMVVGLMAVVFLVHTLLRTLNVQPIVIHTNGDEDDVPPTSDAAQERADDAMTSGDYRAAIRYLYLASLLLLDERGVIRFDPSLTNIEHLRQITEQTQTRGLLEHIVSIFDRVWYGFAPVDDRLYRHFQYLIDQLQQATQTS